MVSVYTDADYLAAYKQKKKILSIFLIVTAAYALFCGAWLAYFISLPYNDPMQLMPKIFVWVASGAYVIFTFIYMGIKYSRIRRYFKMLTFLSIGLKQEEKNYFYCFEEKSLQKDNIDTIGCIFETWNKKKCEWMEREAYFDAEMPLPAFESGDYVRYIVQSNFIIQYEFIQKKALEFEEVEEDYEGEAYITEETEKVSSEENEIAAENEAVEKSENSVEEPLSTEE